MKPLAVAVLVLGSITVCGRAAAQILPPVVEPPTTIEPPPRGYPPTLAPSMPGTYFPLPTWAQSLALAARFVVLTNMQSHAVLDRETGLVWVRQALMSPLAPQVPQMLYAHALGACAQTVVGNRGGWRLPTQSELMTLVNFSISPIIDRPRLSPGHPFFLIGTPARTFGRFTYWTSDHPPSPFSTERRWVVDLETGFTAMASAADEVGGALCVRGPQG